MLIPMSSPDISNAEIEAVKEVLSTPFLSIGPKIEAFEKAFASYVGTKYAVAVNSGTSGLHLAVIASGVKERDTVITTPFSFVASANVVLYERAIPVFVDVERETGNIDPDLVAECIEELKSGKSKARRWLPPTLQSVDAIGDVKAVLPVHAFGQPANMEPILNVVSRFQLRVIEDACEALGSEYAGKKVGTLGDFGVFAFYPNKQMTTGEGGMIVTNNGEAAQLFRSLRNQGRDVFNEWLDHTRLGYNYRMDEMSASLGLVQLSRIEELLSKRSNVAEWYSERLQDVELIDVPKISYSTTRMSWFVYVIRIKKPAIRDKIMRKLAEKGIPSRPYFTPIHLQPLYREKLGYKPGDFPVTEYLGSVSLALPFSSVMNEDQVDMVCNKLKKI